LAPLEKGGKIAIRDSFRDWTFVVHFDKGQSVYGWMQRNDLVSYQSKEGTPYRP
jgi:hypothetical protein